MTSKYDRYYTFDDPVPYKSIRLYPVKVKDYSEFYTYIEVLTLDKNSIPDVNIISMSHLGYVYYLHTKTKDNEGIDYLLLLDYLFKLCMRDSEIKIDYRYDEKKKPIFEINGVIFDSSDFDEIREIICEQNLFRLPDEKIQKEVRDKIDEARKYKEKLSGNRPASFEDTILSLVTSVQMTPEQVYELSIRKFIKLLKRVDAKLHYQIYLQASMSGFVEFKDKSVLRHWMSDLEKENENDDVLFELDQLKKKIENNPA
jgi:hypothetical protein